MSALNRDRAIVIFWTVLFIASNTYFKLGTPTIVLIVIGMALFLKEVIKPMVQLF